MSSAGGDRWHDSTVYNLPYLTVNIIFIIYFSFNPLKGKKAFNYH